MVATLTPVGLEAPPFATAPTTAPTAAAIATEAASRAWRLWRGRNIRRGRLLGAGETISRGGAGAVSLATARDGSILLNAAEIGSAGFSPAIASAVGFVGNPIPARPSSAATSAEFVTASLAVYSIALCSAMAALRPRLVTHQSLTSSRY